MNTSSFISLIDCDNFFVSCERLFRPDLQMRPVLILSSNDGCVISRSEEVKKLGIQMGEPYFKVKIICKEHNVAVFSSNFELYRDISSRVMSVLERFTNNLEVYSIDEAFLEFPITDISLVSEKAKNIRYTVLKEIGVPVSVGVSCTKTLAKIASHHAKPKQGGAGSKVLYDKDDIHLALTETPVGDVWGIGRKLSKKLQAQHVNSAYDFITQQDTLIQKNINILGVRTAQELRGIRHYEVGVDTETRKSLVHSQSFGTPVTKFSTVRASVSYHTRQVAEILRKEGLVAKSLGIKLYTKEYRGGFEKVLLPIYSNDTLTLVDTTFGMLKKIYTKGTLYTKAGVYVQDIIPVGAQPQTTLFNTPTLEHEALMETVDALQRRFGDVMKTGAEINTNTWKAKSAYRSPRYTTVWSEVARIQY